MKTLRWHKLGRFRRNEQGSFTVEASLVLPAVFLCTIAILFFCLFMYQKVSLFHAAAVSADRTAAHWDNSHKDPVTGTFAIQNHDGLYWRVFDDKASDILGLVGIGSPASVTLPMDSSGTGANGPERKLHKAAGYLSNDLSGQLSYQNYWLDRKVSIQLNRLLDIPSLASGWYSGDRVGGESTARVTDPIELIRTVDLTRSYLHQLQGTIPVPEIKTSWLEHTPDVPEIVIGNEKDASKFLRELLNGEEKHFSTSPIGVRREYDVIDRDGVAHDAKVTINNKDMKEQIKKDALLMDRGEVKGVVWHFFRHKSGKLYLTPSVKKELIKNGIVIVVHN